MKQMSGREVVLTLAAASDAATLSAIAWAAKAHWGYPDAWMRVWSDQFEITAEFVTQHWVCVARVDQQPVGFVAIDETLAPPEIVHLWLLPQYQRSGIGRQLVEAAIDEVHLRGMLTLAVESDPNAEGFYLACGATRIGTVPAQMDGASSRVLPRLLFDVHVLQLATLTQVLRRSTREARQALAEAQWASLDISDTFDRCNDAIGGVRWEEGGLQQSSNVRRSRWRCSRGQ